MKKLISEFREFINRGNVMDMAVGIIIGSAFTAIVTSLTDDIINPFIKLLTGGEDASIPGLTIPVADGISIDFSSFISAIINFLIIAAVVFMLLKIFNNMQKTASKIVKVEKEAKSTPSCPFCKEEIKEGATRCPHCASEIETPKAVTPNALEPGSASNKA